ncbi:hypothetical protein DNF23_50845 [Pseudomonas syringae pv. pisi]
MGDTIYPHDVACHLDGQDKFVHAQRILGRTVFLQELLSLLRVDANALHRAIITWHGFDTVCEHAGLHESVHYRCRSLHHVAVRGIFWKKAATQDRIETVHSLALESVVALTSFANCQHRYRSALHPGIDKLNKIDRCSWPTIRQPDKKSIGGEERTRSNFLAFCGAGAVVT